MWMQKCARHCQDCEYNGDTRANNFYMVFWVDIIGKWTGSVYGRTFPPVS